MIEEYVPWAPETLGLSFSISAGRITIFKTTIMVLGNPEFYRFLINEENRMFAVQRCDIDTEGALHLPEDRSCLHYDIKSMDLVRHIYRLCGWNLKRTYRIAGESVPGERLVNFDLAKALEVHEGRLKGQT